MKAFFGSNTHPDPSTLSKELGSEKTPPNAESMGYAEEMARSSEVADLKYGPGACSGCGQRGKYFKSCPRNPGNAAGGKNKGLQYLHPDGGGVPGAPNGASFAAPHKAYLPLLGGVHSAPWGTSFDKRFQNHIGTPRGGAAAPPDAATAAADGGDESQGVIELVANVPGGMEAVRAAGLTSTDDLSGRIAAGIARNLPSVDAGDALRQNLSAGGWNNRVFHQRPSSGSAPDVDRVQESANRASTALTSFDKLFISFDNL